MVPIGRSIPGVAQETSPAGIILDIDPTRHTDEDRALDYRSTLQAGEDDADAARLGRLPHRRAGPRDDHEDPGPRSPGVPARGPLTRDDRRAHLCGHDLRGPALARRQRDPGQSSDQLNPES